MNDEYLRDLCVMTRQKDKGISLALDLKEDFEWITRERCVHDENHAQSKIAISKGSVF